MKALTQTDIILQQEAEVRSVGHFGTSPLDLEDINSAAFYAELSRKWANEDTDVEVEGGEFSSKHYAEKSSDEVQNAADQVVLAAGFADDSEASAVRSEQSAEDLEQTEAVALTRQPGTGATADWLHTPGTPARLILGIPQGEAGTGIYPKGDATFEELSVIDVATLVVGEGWLMTNTGTIDNEDATQPTPVTAGDFVIWVAENYFLNVGEVRGPQGEQGEQGETGLTGATGDSIDSARIGEDDELYVTIAGIEGDPLGVVVGRGIVDTVIIGDNLWISYTDGDTRVLGRVVGYDGENGADGDTGAQGPTGPQGPIGNDGPQGDTGDTGLTGDTGPQGDQGETGQDSTVPGPEGEQGIQGETGLTGDAGADGTDGVDGQSVIIVGDADIPTMNALDPIDIELSWAWVMTEVGTIVNVNGITGPVDPVAIDDIVTYGDGVFVNLGAIQGPAGADGSDGSDGNDGATGDTGAQGDSITAVGIVGVDLIIDIEGEPNNVGRVVGFDGEDGEDGATGQDGATGEQGPIGPEGPEGIQGETGDTGATGGTGPQGDSITAVRIDPPGELIITIEETDFNVGQVVGADGIDGEDGDTGAQGEQGDQGIQGIPGPASVFVDITHVTTASLTYAMPTGAQPSGQALVMLGGVTQTPADYSVDALVLTLTEVPPVGISLVIFANEAGT